MKFPDSCLRFLDSTDDDSIQHWQLSPVTELSLEEFLAARAFCEKGCIVWSRNEDYEDVLENKGVYCSGMKQDLNREYPPYAHLVFGSHEGLEKYCYSGRCINSTEIIEDHIPIALRLSHRPKSA